MNLLANETSPYLRQHAANPVHWRPWGKAAFDAAVAQNKPVLLSIGYAACHWCHVMAHESFEDGATADLMNAHFICIKVDREERPDIDAVYQNALALMGLQGGWPLTMFLTPSGEPFWGGTYFPPHPRHGLPSFREVLRGVHDGYNAESDKIAHNAKNIMGALHNLQEHAQGSIVSRETMDVVAERFLTMTDAVHGGFGTAPKFPNLPAIALLWRAYLRTGGDAYKEAVLNALTQMCQGGIYDHIGGGFCRYTVDDAWLVPHFEKMLGDNALFLDMLGEVYLETKNPLFAQRLRETTDWLIREMTVAAKDGKTAFASSLDADSLTDNGHAQEGAYYTWRASEVDNVLGTDADVFKDAYDITAFGNWEDVNIPNRLKNPSPFTPQEENKMRALRKKLQDARANRAPPARDDKVLADVNGLVILGLCKAAFALSDASYVLLAQNAFDFVTTHMTYADGRLFHSWCDGRAQHRALLEDMANMAAAALALTAATNDAQYLRHAKTWVAILLKEYQDKEQGGFFMTAAGHDEKDHALLLRPKTADDTAMPNGNATAIHALWHLFALTDDDVYLEAATRAAQAFSGGIIDGYFSLCTFLNNSFALRRPLSVLLQGDDDAIIPFMDVLRDMSLPDLCIKRAKDATATPTAIFCVGTSCLAPVTNADAFRKILMEERLRARHGAANDE